MKLVKSDIFDDRYDSGLAISAGGWCCNCWCCCSIEMGLEFEAAAQDSVAIN